MPTPEEMKSFENNARLRDLGIQWSDRIFKEFMEKEGKSSKAEERALFYMALGADTLARMFGDVTKELGEKHGKDVGDQVAQKLLSTAFSLVSMLIRRHGAEVDLQVGVRFQKVANAKAKESGEPECDHSEALTCKCELDQDGQCAKCVGMFEDMFSRIGKAVQVLTGSDNLRGQFCIPCIPRHMDATLARVIREELSDVPKEFSENMIQAMFMASQNLKALPMPLSRKAWSDIQAS